MSKVRCIYCNRSEDDGVVINKSDIIPESLTNAKITCSNVCADDHNSKFGRTFESDVINELEVLRNWLNIKNKDRKYPSYTCHFEIDGINFLKKRTYSMSNPIGNTTLKSEDGTILFEPIKTEKNTKKYDKTNFMKTRRNYIGKRFKNGSICVSRYCKTGRISCL